MEPMVVGLLAIFRFGFDRTTRVLGSVEVVPIESLATLGTGIRWLLRGVTRSSEGCGSAVSTPEDNGSHQRISFVRCLVAVEALFSFQRL